MYVRHIGSGVPRPTKELKGFRRIPLKAGESKQVAFDLPAASLAYWETETRAFRVEADSIRIMVGASSAAIRLQSPDIPVGI